MYAIILTIHSLVRWLLIGFTAASLFKSFTGWQGNRPYTAQDNKLSLFTMICFDVQFLLGLALYLFLSPTTQAAMSDMGAAMKDAELRYWSVEHFSMMILAWILVHVGRATAKKAPNGTAQHKRTFIFYALAVLLVLAAIPWASRPLFRLG
jgi:hypothetical protein